MLVLCGIYGFVIKIKVYEVDVIWSYVCLDVLICVGMGVIWDW